MSSTATAEMAELVSQSNIDISLASMVLLAFRHFQSAAFIVSLECIVRNGDLNLGYVTTLTCETEKQINPGNHLWDDGVDRVLSKSMETRSHSDWRQEPEVIFIERVFNSSLSKDTQSLARHGCHVTPLLPSNYQPL